MGAYQYKVEARSDKGKKEVLGSDFIRYTYDKLSKSWETFDIFKGFMDWLEINQDAIQPEPLPSDQLSMEIVNEVTASVSRNLSSWALGWVRQWDLHEYQSGLEALRLAGKQNIQATLEEITNKVSDAALYDFIADLIFYHREIPIPVIKEYVARDLRLRSNYAPPLVSVLKTAEQHTIVHLALYSQIPTAIALIEAKANIDIPGGFDQRTVREEIARAGRGLYSEIEKDEANRLKEVIDRVEGVDIKGDPS